MITMNSVHLACTFAMLAGLADVGANLAATASQGFAKRGWGLLSILLVLIAFGLLSQAIQGMDLAIAYAVLGTTGILGTALCERVFFGQRLKPIGWLGLACVLGAMMLLQSAGH